jgi:hypothetical protein
LVVEEEPAETKRLPDRALGRASEAEPRPDFKSPTITSHLMRHLRTNSVGTKLTNEFAAVVAACPEPTLSEWICQVPLAVARSQPVDRTILAELLALRAIVITMHFSNGEKLDAGHAPSFAWTLTAALAAASITALVAAAPVASTSPRTHTWITATP